MSYAEEDTRVSYAEEDTCIYCNIYIRLIMLDDLRSSPRFTFPSPPPLTLLTSHCPRPV
jgi:hypothetical protein